jgi:hypothetical protein
VYWRQRRWQEERLGEAARTTGFYGSNHAESFSAAEDRVDAWFGVGVLIVGYFLQAVGYVLELAADNDVRNSGARAVTAALLLVVTILAAWLAWRWTRSRRLRKVLIEMAHWRAPNVRQPPDRDPLPNAERLAAWAEYRGKARDDAEDDRSYVKRVFRVVDVASE